MSALIPIENPPLSSPSDEEATRVDAAHDHPLASTASPAALSRLSAPPGIILVAAAVLACFLTISAVYFGRPVLLPVTVALLLKLLLTPIVQRLERLGLPPMVGAGVVLVSLCAIVLFLGTRLHEPAQKWLADLPQLLPEVEAKLTSLVEPVETFRAASQQVEEIADQVENPEVVKVEVQQPSLASLVLSQTAGFLAAATLSLTLLFFMLASGDRFLRKVVAFAPSLDEKKRVVRLVRRVQTGIARYLGTITVINAGLGVAIAITVWLLGLPNPVLWGAMAAILNFVPFLGLIVGATVIGVVSLLTFDSIGAALLPPLAYLLVNAVECNLITPLALRRSMSMSPVVILLWMTLWTWLWGIPGAIIAVPLLAVVRITLGELEATKRFALLLDP